MLNAGAGDIDVMQVDIIWPGLLGDHFVDVKPHDDQAVLDAMFPTVVRSQFRVGRIVAMPWFTDAPLLFYRADLLEKYGLDVPATCEDLTEAAKTIQDGERAAGNERFWGYVWQGSAYEGLTCDALEWIHSYGGGTIVEPDGSIAVADPRAVRALELAASWVGTISPPAVPRFKEEEARGRKGRGAWRARG